MINKNEVTNLIPHSSPSVPITPIPVTGQLQKFHQQQVPPAVDKRPLTLKVHMFVRKMSIVFLHAVCCILSILTPRYVLSSLSLVENSRSTFGPFSTYLILVFIAR